MVIYTLGWKNNGIMEKRKYIPEDDQLLVKYFTWWMHHATSCPTFDKVSLDLKTEADQEKYKIQRVPKMRICYIVYGK